MISEFLDGTFPTYVFIVYFVITFYHFVMPVKKIKNALTKKRKLTYKELEWDYMPMIVLFAVVAGVLTLLLILLAIYQGIVADEEITKIKNFRNIDNFLNKDSEPEDDDLYYIQEEDSGSGLVTDEDMPENDSAE